MKVHIVGPYYGYTYCINRALERAAECLGWRVQITDPRSSTRRKVNWMHELRLSNADFILCSTVEGWHRNVDPSDLPPKVLWLREEVRREVISNYITEVKDFYDKIFYYEPSGIPIIENLGGKASFLPLACDPKVHKRHKVKKDIGILFIGRTETKEVEPFYAGRDEALRMMRDASLPIVCKEGWDPEENSLLYSRSQICWNLGSTWPEFGPPESLHSVGYQNRVYEGLASGCLVFNHKVKEGRIFNHKQHLIEYTGENLIEQLQYYLEHRDEAQEIADTGYKTLRRNHTYKHRLKEIGDSLNGSC